MKMSAPGRGVRNAIRKASIGEEDLAIQAYQEKYIRLHK
jgi:hypothetical protein